MTILRRLAIAAALLLGLAPALGQVPPPVPALPDTPRLTSYSINTSTCACAVNFQLYGNQGVGDYYDWIEVWLNGVRVNYNDATYGWTIASPTGPLGLIASPITDAVLTFNSAQTGVVQIVGAYRPARLTQFQENAGVSARNLNVAFTQIIATLRETWDKINDVTGRGLFFAPGNVTGPMPTPAQCSSGLLGFDVTGLNPQCYPLTSGGAGIVVSPVRAGDVPYWNGTAWTTLPGNNSGTQVFQENSLGVPSWAAGGGGGGGTACVQDFLAGVGFTAGSTTSLTTTCPVGSAASLSIFFDGVRQSGNTWSVVTATGVATFVAAIPVGTLVVEFQVGAPGSGVAGPASAINNDIATFSGAGGQTIKDSGVSISSITQVAAPGGRLVGMASSCAGAPPVQLATIATVNDLCYVPYKSAYIPINGVNYTFATLTIALNSTHQTTGNIYDVYLVVSGGAAVGCIDANPWTNTTTPSDARSQGANGYYANTPALAHCWNGTTDYGSIAGGAGLYAGTVYANANGATQWSVAPATVSGGTNNVLGIFNAYNRESVTAIERDAKPTWVYGTGTWRDEDASNLNRVTVIDGLGMSQVQTYELMTITGSNPSDGGTTSICFNCDTTPANIALVNNQAGFNGSGQGQTTPNGSVFPNATASTSIGLDYFQALEIGGGGGTTTWFGNSYSGLFVTMAM